MTAVLEVPTSTFGEMLKRERRFEATRMPCPHWCDGTCATAGHFGDAMLHTQERAVVEAVPDRIGAPTGRVTIHAWRDDNLDEPTTWGVELDVTESGSEIGDCATFTAAQARQLGMELLAAADRVDPPQLVEVDVAAPDVKIGDQLKVDGEWLHVYGVLADEPSHNVQISVTADPDEWSDLDARDETPESFTLVDTVRVRRIAARPAGGIR